MKSWFNDFTHGKTILNAPAQNGIYIQNGKKISK